MSKRISLKKFSAVLTFVLLFVFTTFAQSDALQNDLSKSLITFDVVRFNNNDLRSAESSRNISFQTREKTFNLELTPNRLLSPDYKSATTDKSGLHDLEMPEIGIFKGKVAGEENSSVRLTIRDGKILGYFSSENQRFFIEPAKNFSANAVNDEFVVYLEKDMIKREDFECNSEVYAKLERGEKFIGAREIYNFRTFRVVDIATEADFEYVTLSGGANAANAEILSILNMMEGTYENDLQVTFNVVFQHTWQIPDSYIPVNTNTILTSFQNYWNANFTNVSRDMTHIWSGKQNAALSGLSYVGTTCSSPASAYGLSGKIDFAPNKFILSAHEIGHLLNAHHVGAAESCGDTIMIPGSNQFTQLSFCNFSRGEITSFVSSSGSCLSEVNLSPARYDFDGDNKADIAVFRPSAGNWYVQTSRGVFSGVSFGQNGDKIVPADFDGDAKTDISVYRNGYWYRINSSINTFVALSFGAADDIPHPADFDGDNKADINVFRPSNGVWYRLNSTNSSFTATQFGTNRDIPVPADYDGDGRADLNIYRPSNGGWYRINSNNGSFSGTQFGLVQDKPLIGDFDGDGKADIAVYRPSNGAWYVQRSSDNGFSGVSFGLSTDIPVPADFDGDGKTDIAVYRPSNGTWYRTNSNNNSFAATSFGTNGDIPVSGFYVQ